MTDLHTHPDYLAALRAIRAAGDDDLERLKLADWLDERAASVACPRCEEGWATSRHRNYQSDDYSSSSARCEHCHGTGRAGDGLAERAELIRVQCELARVMQHRPGHNAGTSTGMRDPTKVWRESVNPLRRRERDLLDTHGRAWAGFDYHSVNAIDDPRGEPLSTYIEYERGFPFSVRGPLGSLWRLCKTCEGKGKDAYVIGAFGPFPDGCPHCPYHCGHAGAMAALGPEVLCVGRVEVTDREPAAEDYLNTLTNEEGTDWVWREDNGHLAMDRPHQIPGWLFDHIDLPKMRDFPTLKVAASPAIARATLSAAVLTVAYEPWLLKDR